MTTMAAGITAVETAAGIAATIVVGMTIATTMPIRKNPGKFSGF
jgi:hypothetical protein